VLHGKCALTSPQAVVTDDDDDAGKVEEKPDDAQPAKHDAVAPELQGVPSGVVHLKMD